MHSESWPAYLAELITEDEQEGIRVDGMPVSGSDTRALYRWRREGVTPNLDKADAFLCRYDLNFTFYELWCELEGRPVWQHGPPPGFED